MKSANVNGRQGRGGRSGRSGRGGRDNGGGRGQNHIKAKGDEITLPTIGMDAQQLTLKPILQEWLNRHYPRVASVVKRQCYLIPPAPTKEKIRQRWLKIQRGDLTAALGIDGVRFDDGVNNDGGEIDYNFGFDDEEESSDQVDAADDEQGPEGRREDNTDGDDGSAGLSERAVNKAFENEHQSWVEAIEKFEDQRKRAFDELWDRLGVGLRGAVRSNPEWDRVEAKQDLLRLYKMIMVALVAHGAIDKRTRRMYTKDAYDKIRMHQGENLEKFKERFDDCLAQYRGTGQLVEDYQAADDFLMKLDDRFERLRETQSRTGRYTGAMYYGDRAESVEEIFRAAQQELTTARSLRDAKGHRNPGHVNTDKAGLSFVGSGKQKGGKKGGAGTKGTKCDACGGQGHSLDHCTSKEGSEITCFNCGGVGHYKNRCPSDEQKEAAEEMKKK